MDLIKAAEARARRNNILLFIEFAEKSSVSFLFILRTAMPNLVNSMIDFFDTMHSAALSGLGIWVLIARLKASLDRLPDARLQTESINSQPYLSIHYCVE